MKPKIPSSSRVTHYSTGHSTRVVFLISTTYKFCNHWYLHEVTAVIKRSKPSDLIYLLFWSFLESFHKIYFASSPLRQKHQETLTREPSECSSTIKRSQGQSQNLYLSQIICSDEQLILMPQYRLPRIHTRLLCFISSCIACQQP